MKVAVRSTSWFGQYPVDLDGKINGSHSGAVLVRRLLRLFDEDAILLVEDGQGTADAKVDGYTIPVMPIKDVIGLRDLVVINMDVVDSAALFGRLRRTWRDPTPQIVNFVWWNTSEFVTDAERASIAVSTSLFPTFCNSARTAREIRALQSHWMAPARIDSSRVAYWNLGIDIEALEAARRLPKPGHPIVLYPGNQVFARKQPSLWCEIVEKVAVATDVKPVMRVGRGWEDVYFASDPLPSKTDYYESLCDATAFLATSLDESYGLAHAEALFMGAIGVFPDRDWTWTLVPEAYPFVYRDKNEAAAMLLAVVKAPQWALDNIDVACGERPWDWIRREHNAEHFDLHLKEMIETWYPTT